MRLAVGTTFAVVAVAAAAGCTRAATTAPEPGPTGATSTAPEPRPTAATATAATRAQPLRARAAHTATLLVDGRVPLVGGCAEDGCGTADVAPDRPGG